MSDEPQKAYLVTQGSYSDFSVERVYLDKDEAQAYLDARRAEDKEWADWNDLEEFTIGAGGAEYDGPGWYGVWTYTPLGTDWREPDNWRESLAVRPFWYTGDQVTARVKNEGANYRYERRATAQGTSKEHVEKALQDLAAQIKAEVLGLT